MAKTDFPPPSLKRVLRYDPKTGHFHWRIKTHGNGGVILPGDIAGSPNSGGYLCTKLDGALYRNHRLAWYVMTGEWLPSTQDIDHENGKRADNRWSNLRLATRTQNNHNRFNIRSDNKSGQTGVSWRKDTNKWHARVKVEGRTILLGDFIRLEDAVAARKAAEVKHFGAFAPNHPVGEP